MTKEEYTKRFKASIELKRQMLEESQRIMQRLQHEFQTTGQIACL